ncbi:transposase family protein [Burkholderia sp. ABCPW 111]|nr:transposase family protein [Burkholderia sp. ABCPW 111]
MKKRFNEEQIIGILKGAEAGLKPAELCCKYGISEATYYNWKTKFGGMTVSEAQCLKELGQENNKLKHLPADSMLDIHANHKRVHRLYREAGLAARRRRRRRGVMIEREQLALPNGPNEVWSIDFVTDALSNGWRLKCLTIVDDFTKEAVDIVVDHGISGLYVARELDMATRFRGYPKALRTDQGSEFTSRALDRWAYANGVTLKLIQAGKPTQNAYIESFNGKFRDECLNEHWFTTLAQTALRQRMCEIAATRVRYGYRKIRVLLLREGYQVSKNRLYRLYREEGLSLRYRPNRKRRAQMSRPARAKSTAANQVWSLDFVADQLSSGQRFRALTIIDVFTREALAIDVGQRLGASDVVRVLGELKAKREAPRTLLCDNGSEFTSQVMDLWAYHQKVEIAFSRPGKPTDNAFVESFNGTLRDECLNAHWFTDARAQIERWRVEYNESRPHRALGEVAPAEYARQLGLQAQLTDQQKAED